MATDRFSIVELVAAQAQKHVTINEALRTIDAALNLTVIRSDLTTPPGAPTQGDTYIVAATASGDWTGEEGNIACFTDNAWVFFTPQEGWRCFDQNAIAELLYLGSAWRTVWTFGAGSVHPQIVTLEETLSGLSGASVSSTIAFPNQCTILGAAIRITTTITGSGGIANLQIGDGSSATRFGTVGLTAGTTSQGTVNGDGNYASTNVVLTPDVGSFTGGEVKVAIHYISVGVPLA